MPISVCSSAVASSVPVAALEQLRLAKTRPAGHSAPAMNRAATQAGGARRAMVGAARTVRPRGATELADGENGRVVPDRPQPLGQRDQHGGQCPELLVEAVGLGAVRDRKSVV